MKFISLIQSKYTVDNRVIKLKTVAEKLFLST